MADELNVPTHRWYEPRNNISLPKTDFSAQTIYDSGIQKIDAWINSQPWGSPVPGLFALAEPGVWYDPSDLTTLFQDAAGTQPVTTAGQTVALALDKSKGLVLGPELVTNGTFDADLSGWSTTTFTWDSGTAVASATNPSISQGGLTFTAGRTYEIRITSSNVVGGTMWIRLSGGTAVSSPTFSNGSFVFRLTSTGNTTLLVEKATGTVTSATIDNISVRELAGNHAKQATAASRPTYGVDATGRGYLSFDGVDDFLVTPTITPNIDKAQVFAGVRKLSDAARSMVAELSTTTANNGSFGLEGPGFGAGATYGWTSKGTSNSTVTPTGFASPITSVLTGLGDISGDLATLRVNGTEAAQSTADQGTGNFLAYPIYIGRRGGTTLPFNGRLYSLIVRFGANLDANTITNTETWVNSKTGAY